MILIQIQIDQNSALLVSKARQLKEAFARTAAETLGAEWSVYTHPEASVLHCFENKDKAGHDPSQHGPGGLVRLS